MSMIADDRLHGYHWAAHWYALMRLQAPTPQAPNLEPSKPPTARNATAREHRFLQTPTVPKAQRNVTKTLLGYCHYVCSVNTRISLATLLIFTSLNSAGSAATIILRVPKVPISRGIVCSLAAYNYSGGRNVSWRQVTPNDLAYHVPQAHERSIGNFNVRAF
jgi:hypothetical protein